MDLKSGRPFWPTQNEKFPKQPPLRGDLRCDVAIIGAGLTGALVAHALSKEGIEAVLLDKRGVARGSTSASTALIQYEIDVPLFKLMQMRGEKEAVQCYRLCRAAIHQIEQTVDELEDSCRFVRRPSLYLARQARDVADLKREFRTRQEAGFQLEYLSACDVSRRFSFSSPGALLSSEGAEIDPYCFAQRLIRHARRGGLRVCVPQTVRTIEPGRNSVTLKTEGGQRVLARKVIVAAGYESRAFFRRKLVRLKSTYALTTQPLEGFEGWTDRCLIWEAGRPYHYLRTTHDSRIMIGGGDEDFLNAEKRDTLLGKKTQELQQRLEKMFPRLKIKPAFAWAGTFGDTKDGLPYIGSLPSSRNILFTLCYGANGTNFAVIGANLARDWVREKRNPNARLFTFDR
jgi:glycine/D-amino acid oxidase-like deaminating enzyme